MKRSIQLLQETTERLRENKIVKGELDELQGEIEVLERVPKTKITFEEYTMKNDLRRYCEYKQNIISTDNSVNTEKIVEVINFEMAESLEHNEHLESLVLGIPIDDKPYLELFNSLLEELRAEIEPYVDELKEYLETGHKRSLEAKIKTGEPKPLTKFRLENLKEYEMERISAGITDPDGLIAYKYGVKVRRY